MLYNKENQTIKGIMSFIQNSTKNHIQHQNCKKLDKLSMDFDSRKNTYITFAKEKRRNKKRNFFFQIFSQSWYFFHFPHIQNRDSKAGSVARTGKNNRSLRTCPSRQFIIRVWDNNIELLTVLTFLQIIAYYFHLYPREA